VPSDIVVVEMAGGATLSRTVGTLNLEVDAAIDRLTGQAEPNSTVRAVVGELTEHGWRDVNASTPAASNGDYLIDFSGIVDLMPGQWAGVLVADDEGDDLNLWDNTPSVEVHQTWDEVYGCGPSPSPPESEGRVVTLTLVSTTTVYTTEMGWGNWYSFNQDAHGLPDIAPGEVVTVEAEGYPRKELAERGTRQLGNLNGLRLDYGQPVRSRDVRHAPHGPQRIFHVVQDTQKQGNIVLPQTAQVHRHEIAHHGFDLAPKDGAGRIKRPAPRQFPRIPVAGFVRRRKWSARLP
jgi:hypothetical protein